MKSPYDKLRTAVDSERLTCHDRANRARVVRDTLHQGHFAPDYGQMVAEASAIVSAR